MGTFAVTANVNYRLSFADQGEQTSVFLCRKQTEVCCLCFQLVPFSVSIYIEMAACIYIFIIFIYLQLYIYMFLEIQGVQ
jgi:hypothetical protein